MACIYVCSMCEKPERAAYVAESANCWHHPLGWIVQAPKAYLADAPLQYDFCSSACQRRAVEHGLVKALP